MKKIDLGQLITILANLGVLAGILLLVYELAQNRAMMRSQTRHAVAELLVGLLAQEASDPTLSGIRLKLRSGQPLTALEAEQFEAIELAYWRYREDVHFQYRNGLYDEDEYAALRAAWLDELDSNEQMRTIFCRRGANAVQALNDEMNSLMQRPCTE